MSFWLTYDQLKLIGIELIVDANWLAFFTVP